MVDRETGAVKAKGAYVKKLSDLDYDLPIVNRAISEYFSHKTTPEETIMGCGDLRDFQKVVKFPANMNVRFTPLLSLWRKSGTKKAVQKMWKGSAAVKFNW